MQGRLLTLAAVAECATGLALVLMPGWVIMFLLGVEARAQGEMIGRLAGVALVALGAACGGAAADPGGVAQTATTAAITVYNAGAGALLLLYAATGSAVGPVIWAVAALHVAFAVAFSFNSLVRRRARV